MSEPLLRVEDLVKNFESGGETIHALNGVTFDLEQGNTLGIIGESGCGKTTLARTTVRLYQPTSGSIYYKGEDISAHSERELSHLRGQIQYVFQNPFSSLNPKMSVFQNVARGMKIHGLAKRKTHLREKALDVLTKVGLTQEQLDRYPHEFSGGQRQRIAIARALALRPNLILFDEPTSSLDVSVQAEILNLIKARQEDQNYSYLFITHDISVAQHLSDNLAIMYLGRMMERGPKNGIFHNPLHPYTRALLSATYEVGIHKQKRVAVTLKGSPPSMVQLPKGCFFYERCPECGQNCEESKPIMVEVNESHFVACHHCHKE